MKKAILFLICVSAFGAYPLVAQSVTAQSIEDTVLGWMKVYDFKTITEPRKVDDKLYSAAQLTHCSRFTSWIQASYIPRGGLGDVKRLLSEKLGLYNRNTASLPQSYGAYAKIYTELKYNSSGKLEPLTNSHVFWSVVANAVPDWPIFDISTPEQYYFAMPSFESAESGEEAARKTQDLSAVAQLKPYITFWMKNLGYGGGTENVLLCRDNKSPFIKITKGEYLQLLEAALPRVYETEKKKIHEQNRGNQRSIDYFMKYLDDKNAKRLARLDEGKARYAGRLQEIAELFTSQPDIQLENYPDIFEGTGAGANKFPIYKVDPRMAELCKKDAPQWIVVSWRWNPAVPAEKHLHEAIIHNFNFAYVYDYFFAPEKVQGQPYTPLRSPGAVEAAIASEASAAGKMSAADKNSHFFEDFSTTAVGQKPAGWHNKLADDGTVSTIVNLDGVAGNWAVMNGNYALTARGLKKPLPRNFTLSYELAAARNFTWGAKGLTMQLAKETAPGNAESFVALKLRPGFDGKDGEAAVELKFPSGYASGSKWFTAPGFSNDKKYNRIVVSLKKAGETLQIFIDETRMAEYEKAIPAELAFNALSFFVNGSSGENDKFYITNIKISRD